jgi:hypothetical protein
MQLILNAFIDKPKKMPMDIESFHEALNHCYLRSYKLIEHEVGSKEFI